MNNKNIANQKEEQSKTLNSLTQERATESNAVEIPRIELPKGGGALKGIDEKFEVNAANGTAAFSISLPLSPGRNGFAPTLALSYNSGGGNGLFGLGWDVSLPSIQRKTDKGLPQYETGEQEDIFLFSGVEDLTPFLKEENDWKIEDQTDGDFTIRQYRPRIEGGFTRIERITYLKSDVYWKVTTPDNVVTFFGRTEQTRIADPEDPSRIFQWLPEFSYDDKGNCLQYEYKAENLDGVAYTLAEHNRFEGLAPFANLHLKRVRYGNQQPYFADQNQPYNPSLPNHTNYFFEVIFDYGEHRNQAVLGNKETPFYTPVQAWTARPDAFSSYRSGFEIRTYRRCLGVLMYHHFPQEQDFGAEYLVRSLDLEYEPSSINQSGMAEVTYLKSITQTAYIRTADETYSKKSLPPLEFTYQQLDWNREIKTVDSESMANVPVGLTNNYQWVDLYSEGISGILTEQANAWYYKSNLGDLEKAGRPAFSVAQRVAPKPSYLGLSSGLLSLQDLEADGKKQIVVQNERRQGFFELGADKDWLPFQAFSEVANIDLSDPNVRLIDLNGDGRPDLVVSEENVFVWYAAKGKKGRQAARRTLKVFGEEQGPAIVFADQEQSIFLADMSGDGLTDIVRIRNGEICYWANKGYGHFSAKINMNKAPVFDRPDQFNPKYLHLADVSGTGATDVVYLGGNQFKAFINLSGNAWSDAHKIEPFAPLDNNSRLSVVDLLGTGTSCIVWSSDLPHQAHAPMRYIDLMNGKKPHVMIKHINNMGKETSVEYKSSTWFYLKDKREGKPWITKLPFPVQVVHKTIVEEKIANVRFASEYSYHHGYYDHAEREFRGFGRVEQLDTEHYDNWKKNNAGNALEQSVALYQAPMLTKTWYHTGAFLDRENILNQFEKEYWYRQYNQLFADSPLAISEPKLKDAIVKAAANLNDQRLIEKLSADEWREAIRACKGMALRQEVFALDGDGNPLSEAGKKQAKPYSVATHNCHIQLLQPRSEQQYGVFLATESEAVAIQYERDETDPRISHSLNIKIDDRGNVLESASVVYGRRQINPELPAKAQAAQSKTHIIYSENSFTNDVVEADAYRSRTIAEAKTWEITGLNKRNPLYQLSDFARILTIPNGEIPYHESATNGAQRRLIEHIRTLYLKDDLTGALPIGQLESKGLPYESYQLAYTPELLDQIYGDKIADQEATMTEGRFVHTEGDDNWWIRSGLMQFLAAGETLTDAQNRFYSPLAYTDPFGASTKVFYYKDYFLFPESMEDALQNSSKVERFDFRVLSPSRMRDVNDNLSEVLLDELGLVKAVAILGKDLDGDGVPELELTDNLEGLQTISESEQADIVAFFQTENSNELNEIGERLLKNATSRFVYDFEVYQKTGRPAVAASINRETHSHHLAEGEKSVLQFGFEYSDGLGRVAMVKAQAEPGIAKQAVIQSDGAYQINEVNTADFADDPRLRWIGNGRTVLNNKGNPVKQYEPYFSVSPHYEAAKELVETGVTPINYYDAPGRLIKTELPNETFVKVEFDSWQERSYDANDTVLESPWYKKRSQNLIDAELLAAGKDPRQEKIAAEKAAKHSGTPAVLHLDSLGRPILSVEHNRKDGQDEFYHTFIALDIEGNTRSVADARGNTVMAYQYDMLGHRVYQNSMDAGERWMLNNVMGNPVQTWDSRRHVFTHFYDEIQRPLSTKATGENNGQTLNNVFAKVVYGDFANMSAAERQNRKRQNQIGQPIVTKDTSGQISLLQYDLKGNLLLSQKQLLADYKNMPDWDGNPLLENEIFQTAIELDALDRPQKESIRYWKTTDSNGEADAPLNQRRYTYNNANLLNGVHAIANGTDEQEYVRNIDYDEKGQRTHIQYGNGTTTTYKYDQETFRLLNLHTTRDDSPSGAGDETGLLQDLRYTYDPVGNISYIRNAAEDRIFFNNQEVEAHNGYEYDALYRLIFATGRDHAGQNANQPDSQFDEFRTGLAHKGDGTALQNYRRHYRYDAVGNLLELRHIAGQDGNNRFTKTFTYSDANNQLLQYQTGSNIVNNHTFAYDAHGNMNQLDAQFQMQWNTFDQLENIQLNNEERAFYAYDGNGERTRKIIERNGVIQKERLYLGGFEIYRDVNGLERETLHIMDDQSRIALIETKTKQGASNDDTEKTLARYQYGNHLGSAALELNETGEIISYEEYYPYGTTSYQAVNQAVKSAAKRYRYTGMERDEESGLSYHSARYYAPWLCRWTAADPIGIGDGVNVYGYVGGRPTKRIDSIGMASCDSNVTSCTVSEEEKYVPMVVAEGEEQNWLQEQRERKAPMVLTEEGAREWVQQQQKKSRTEAQRRGLSQREREAPMVLTEEPHENWVELKEEDYEVYPETPEETTFVSTAAVGGTADDTDAYNAYLAQRDLPEFDILIEVKGSVKYSPAAMHKDAGISGVEITGPSVTLAEVGIRGRSETAFTPEPINYVIDDFSNPEKGDLAGVKVESPEGDIKYRVEYEIDPKTGEMKIKRTAGIGGPGWEAKTVTLPNGSEKIFIGPQEDVGTAIPLGDLGFLSFKLDMRLQLVAE